MKKDGKEAQESLKHPPLKKKMIIKDQSIKAV